MGPTCKNGWDDLTKYFTSPHSYGVIGSSIYGWKGLGIKFSTIYPMLPFELAIQSKNTFKDRVSKLSIKNPKKIFPTICIFNIYLGHLHSPLIFDINDNTIYTKGLYKFLRNLECFKKSTRKC
jgi:hypothetical protein